MERRLALAAVAAFILFAEMAFAAGVTSGQIVLRDRARQIVQLSDGHTYYIPNRVYMRDFRPRRWITIWYVVRDGVRVVVNYDVRRRRDM